MTHLKFLVLDEADDLQKKDDRKEIPRLNAQIKRGRRDRVRGLAQAIRAGLIGMAAFWMILESFG